MVTILRLDQSQPRTFLSPRRSLKRTKLENLEHRMDKLEGYLVGIKDSLDEKLEGRGKQSVSVLVSILGVILAGLIGFIGSALFK